MRRFLFAFLLGMLTGAGSLWYLQSENRPTSFNEAAQQMGKEAEKLKQSMQDTFTEITGEMVREELERSSVIIRDKAKQAGQAIMDATANARLTAAIKTKLFAEPGVSALSINVDSADGLVTLSGTAANADQIARIIRIALDTEGVKKVVSTIQIEETKK